MPTNAPPRIAIPMPHSLDREYSERAIPQYERAIERAGGKPVRIPLDQPPPEVAKIIEGCDGVLLPGSNADVDPARFKAPRSPHTGAADPRRAAVDDILLQEAYAHGKPVLGICYGLQSLNVFRGGSLVQHILDFLPEDLRSRVDHEAGKRVAIAHDVMIEKDSKLTEIVGGNRRGVEPDVHNLGSDAASAVRGAGLILPVNSSHHQSADRVGNGLRISARCTDDGIVEALEGTDRDHFVLAVQWHPERSVDLDEPSRAIFRVLIEAAKIRPK